MKDVDDDDKSSSDEDNAADNTPDNDDVSDDGQESIAKKNRKDNQIVCGYCLGDRCDCRCLITRKRCKCIDRLDKNESMQFTPLERSQFLANMKKDTDTSSDMYNPSSFKSKSMLADKKVSFDVPKKQR